MLSPPPRPSPPVLSPRVRALRLAGMAVSMAVIFTVDTTTQYEVAVAVFYALVILTAVRVLPPRGVVWLCAGCLGLALLSFGLSAHGDYHAGLVNLAISITAIVMVTWLIIKMETARDAAQAAQAQLLRLTRVQRLDGLTTAIAHEVNQPLAAIVTSAHACQRWLGQEPPHLDKAAQAVTRILHDAARASQIVTRVRSLSRGEPVQAVAFDFNRAVLEIVALSRAEIDRHGIALVLDLAPEMPPALADPVQIQQVIGNLLLNALEAMAAKPGVAHRLQMRSLLTGGTIVLTVADTGVGIPAAVQAHVFDAFWTTKADGTGVGLSISRTMMEANGGQIWAEPAAGGGAVFSISVPIAAEECRR